MRRLGSFVMVGIVCGCADREPTGGAPGSATDAFDEVSRIALDTTVAATVGRLNALLPLGDQVLVADGMTDRVLSFAPDGRFLHAVGGPGDGPGEFRTPMALAEMDGAVLVSDFTQRITEFGPDLEFRRVHRLDQPTLVGDVARSGRDLMLAHWLRRGPGPNVYRWRPDSGLGGSFDPGAEPPPYWSVQPRIAVRDIDIVVADAMAYPLRRYGPDGRFIDSLGTPPPSWRQASRPELGEFSTPEGQGRGRAWMRSYSTVDGLHSVGSGWLVVSHRTPTNEYREDDEIRVDLYHGTPPEKVWEDVVLPGPVVGSDGRCVWVVVEHPPEPWTVACWAPRTPR